MRKKRVSGSDLSWMIFERMREEIGNQRPLSIAVVPDTELGWRAILEGRSGRKLSAAARKKLHSIENELRASFSLARD